MQYQKIIRKLVADTLTNYISIYRHRHGFNAGQLMTLITKTITKIIFPAHISVTEEIHWYKLTMY